MAKGNPNPNPSTRFGADNPGRAKQKGARDRLSAAFLKTLADDFDAHGKTVVEKVRNNDPSNYLRIMAAVIPKELEVTHPLDGVPDGELVELIDALRAMLGRAGNGDRPPVVN